MHIELCRTSAGGLARCPHSQLPMDGALPVADEGPVAHLSWELVPPAKRLKCRHALLGWGDEPMHAWLTRAPPLALDQWKLGLQPPQW
jgi:hypothetical protein